MRANLTLKYPHLRVAIHPTSPSKQSEQPVSFQQRNRTSHLILVALELQLPTMLHLAVSLGSKKVFEYLLAIPGVDIDEVNVKGETPLLIAVNYHTYEFIYELLNKGANIHAVLPDGSTLLNQYFRTQLLEYNEDFVVDMLIRGADPWSYGDRNFNFERAVLFGTRSLRDTMFLYTFDGYTRWNMSLRVLIKLAFDRFEYFFDVMSCVDEVEYDDRDPTFCLNHLFRIKRKYLKVLMSKAKSALDDFFNAVIFTTCPLLMLDFFKKLPTVRIEKLRLFIEGDLRNSFFDCLEGIGASRIFISRGLKNHDYELKFFCYLLSHGLYVNERLIQNIYEKYGFCELFRILLHIDIDLMPEYFDRRNAMATLIYNINVDLPDLLQTADEYSHLEELLQFFVIPDAKNYFEDEEVLKKIESLPKVSLLEELARNATRKALIQTYNMKSVKEFCVVVQNLDVSQVVKKVLMYQQALY